MNSDAWFSDLFERNYALLYRIGRVFLGTDHSRAPLIEDQIQEAFLRAWQKRRKLQRHPNPDGWLVECFRNCLMNACRKQSRDWKHLATSATELTGLSLKSGEQPLPEDYVKAREQVDLLHHLLGDADAEVFLRYCVYGEKGSELASELGISEPALRMRVSRIKKKILSNHKLFTCLVILCLWGIG